MLQSGRAVASGKRQIGKSFRCRDDMQFDVSHSLIGLTCALGITRHQQRIPQIYTCRNKVGVQCRCGVMLF
jgi:hypothetical protein